MSKLINSRILNFKKNRFFIIGLTAVVILIIGTTFYHFVEGLDWLDALYFSVVTLTTVGYGDFSPQTDIGKIFTIIYIIGGIGIIFGFMSAFYEKRLEKINKYRENREKNKK